jgi:hypothetical protein
MNILRSFVSDNALAAAPATLVASLVGLVAIISVAVIKCAWQMRLKRHTRGRQPCVISSPFR